MKLQKPELQNTRVIRLAVQFLSLPFVLLAALFRLPKQLLHRLQLKSDKELHEEDQLRQSRIRRQLRGLPADHVHESVESS